MSTPLQTKNSTSIGITNKTIQNKRSKSIDMLLYWLKDHVSKGQYHVFWCPGPTNSADYHTKHHTETHHIDILSTLLQHNAFTSKAKFLNKIICEGVLIPLHQ